jgi:hypothetical protein
VSKYVQRERGKEKWRKGGREEGRGGEGGDEKERNGGEGRKGE